MSTILSKKRVGRRLSVAVFEGGDKSDSGHPVHEEHIKKQNFIVDVHLEEEEEVDEIGNIIEAMCNSDYLERLTQIFQFYASYGDSYNLISMKVSNFVKFMRETKYLPADFPLAQLQVTFKEALKVDIKTESSNDLLSKRKRKNQVSFRGWLRCLCKCVIQFKSNKTERSANNAQDLAASVEKFVKHYLFVNSESLKPLPDADFLLEEKVVEVMRNNTALMMKIYNYYATPCRTRDDRLYLRQEGLKNLFAEFKVPQAILSKLELFRIWNHVAHEHDMMEFPEFLEVLGRSAIVGFSKAFLKDKYTTDESKVKAFLELFRYNEKLRFIIEENRQLGKQVNMHKMQKHQFLGKGKNRRIKRTNPLHRLYYQFGSPLKHSMSTPVANASSGNDDDSMSIINPPRLSELVKHSPPKSRRKMKTVSKEENNADHEEELRIKQAGGLTKKEKMCADEWDQKSSHLMSSKVSSSIFSPMWKADKPLERAVRVLAPYDAQLLEVFEYYCFLNNRQVLNFSKLDSFNWMKFLRDSKLMREDNDSYDGDELADEMHDLWISRAEADIIYADLSHMEKPHGWISYDRFKLGIARVAHILEYRVGTGGLRHHKVNEKKFNILEKREKRLHDFPQVKSPVKKQFLSPSKPRQASIHLTWQPTSPKRFNLQNANVLQKVARESETDRAERLLDLIEDEEDSMDYIHMNENYREQILDLADSLLIMLEQHVLKYAKRVSCFGYGHEESETAINQLNEVQVVSILKEQEMTLQRIFTYYSTKRHDQKPFWEPGENRSMAISFKELEDISNNFNLSPALLTKSEMFMCFRAARRDPVATPDALSYSEWVECFARLGLLAFSKPYLQKQHPLPEQRVHGFFGWLKASEGMNEIENEEWAKGHGYTGVKMTKAFLKGDHRIKKTKIADISSGHDIVKQFNYAMSKIREAALSHASSRGKLNLKREFDAIDEDGDGTIQREEFIHFVHDICGGGKDSPINDDDINSIFHVLDPDDNGTITYGEFTYQFYNRRSIVKKLRSDSIISNGSLSPTNLDPKFAEEERKEEGRHKMSTQTKEKGHAASAILPFRPTSYDDNDFQEIHSKLRVASKSWLGSKFQDLPSLIVVKDDEKITLEEFQSCVQKLSQGTDAKGRISSNDVVALYHLLTADLSKPLSMTSVIDFLRSEELQSYGIKAKSNKQMESEGKVKPFRKTTTRSTIASNHQRHPRRNDIVPIKFGRNTGSEVPTIEEIAGIFAKQRDATPSKVRSGDDGNYLDAKNTYIVDSKKNNSRSPRHNQWVRANNNKTTPSSKSRQLDRVPTVAKMMKGQSKICAPKLFIRSPGEMKYIKRMRAANKERERVTKLTTMRRVSPRNDMSKSNNSSKTSKTWKKIEKRGSFFGMYKPNRSGDESNASGNHLTGTVDNTATNIKTIRGGTKSTSATTTKIAEQNGVGNGERKSPKGTSRRFKF